MYVAIHGEESIDGVAQVSFPSQLGEREQPKEAALSAADIRACHPQSAHLRSLVVAVN